MTTFVEKDCTVEFQGQKFEAGGAYVTDDVVLGYLGQPQNCNEERVGAVGPLNDWHGNRIGSYHITSRWRMPWQCFSSSHYCAVTMVVNGVVYRGRSAGVGMCAKGKRAAKQPKQ